MKDYYTIEETEKGIEGFLPIPKITQANYRKQGLLHYIKVGRQIYYKTEHIKQLFLSLESKSMNTKAE
jgi:ribosomal protein S1